MARQSAAKKNYPDMIYCERCGEDYAATYRTCPFCDEHPGRRIDDSRRARGPLQLAVLVGSLVVILAAAFIVFSKVAPLLTTPEDNPVNQPENPGVNEPISPLPEQQPEDEQPGVTEPDPSAVPANAVVLSREDITLVPNETYTLLATVAPANTTDTLVWSCDNPDVLTVNQDGSLVNKNTTGEKVVVNVTATAGGVSAQCIVRCNSSMVVTPSGGDTTEDPPEGNTPTPSSGVAVTGKINAKVVGAGSGLNVRSGPGSNYEKVASIANGNSVVILENTGTGWYKIDYGGGKTGYASVDYIQPK